MLHTELIRPLLPFLPAAGGGSVALLSVAAAFYARRRAQRLQRRAERQRRRRADQWFWDRFVASRGTPRITDQREDD